jgi:16S rRNA processing protein RimM
LKSSKKNDTSGTDRLVSLGRLVRTHGVGGEVRLRPYAFPCPTLKTGLVVQLQDRAGQQTPARITKLRPRPPFLLVAFEGVVSREQAQALCGRTVAVGEHQLPPLQDNEFYYYQVIGLTVLTTAGQEIGTVREVFFSGGHDVWVVRQGEKEYMIPITQEIVRSMDIPGRQAVIEPLDGLLD